MMNLIASIIIATHPVIVTHPVVAPPPRPVIIPPPRPVVEAPKKSTVFIAPHAHTAAPAQRPASSSTK